MKTGTRVKRTVESLFDAFFARLLGANEELVLFGRGKREWTSLR